MQTLNEIGIKTRFNWIFQNGICLCFPSAKKCKFMWPPLPVAYSCAWALVLPGDYPGMVVNAQEKKNGTGVAGLNLEMFLFLLPVKGFSWNIHVHSKTGREGCLWGSDPQGDSCNIWRHSLVVTTGAGRCNGIQWAEARDAVSILQCTECSLSPYSHGTLTTNCHTLRKNSVMPKIAWQEASLAGAWLSCLYKEYGCIQDYVKRVKYIFYSPIA